MNHTIQRWRPISPELRRVQEKARARPDDQFTSLAHYLSLEALQRAYDAVEPNSAPGVDGVAKQEYGFDLEQRLGELHKRLKDSKSTDLSLTVRKRGCSGLAGTGRNRRYPNRKRLITWDSPTLPAGIDRAVIW